MTPVGNKPVIVALDFPSESEALDILEQLDAERCRVKIGKELFTRAGPPLVRRAIDAGFDVFLDLKFHDIPNTVAGACAAAADLGCWMINVHASGGRAMMEAAAGCMTRLGSAPLLVGVTVLTSMDEAAVREVGFDSNPAVLVPRLAKLAQACGLDGVVSSPRELSEIREICGAGFITVTPGVRPVTASQDDQKRVATPADAIAAGANYLVVGRPITQAPDPASALESICAEIESAAR